MHFLESQKRITQRNWITVSPGGSVGKESTCDAGDAVDAGSIPGSGRSPGEGNGNPSQYSWEIPWTEELGRLQFRGQKSWT